MTTVFDVGVIVITRPDGIRYDHKQCQTRETQLCGFQNRSHRSHPIDATRSV